MPARGVSVKGFLRRDDNQAITQSDISQSPIQNGLGDSMRLEPPGDISDMWDEDRGFGTPDGFFPIPGHSAGQ